MQSASKKIFAITALLKAAPPFHRNPSGDQKNLGKKTNVRALCGILGARRTTSFRAPQSHSF